MVTAARADCYDRIVIGHVDAFHNSWHAKKEGVERNLKVVVDH